MTRHLNQLARDLDAPRCAPVRRNEPYEGKIVVEWRGTKVYRDGCWVPYQRQGTNDA